jgi:hypothetical protein
MTRPDHQNIGNVSKLIYGKSPDNNHQNQKCAKGHV